MSNEIAVVREFRVSYQGKATETEKPAHMLQRPLEVVSRGFIYSR